MTISKYVDKRIVISAAIGAALFGAVIYAMDKSGVRIAKDAAKIAQGG